MPAETLCWWSWDPICDIPNWVSLVIEGIVIGGGLGFFFYWLQRRKSKKREKYALKKLSSHLVTFEDFSLALKNLVDAYRNKTGTMEDLSKSLENTKEYCKDIRYDLTVFSQDIDEKLIDAFDQLLGSVERPLSFVKGQPVDEFTPYFHRLQLLKIRQIIDSYDKKYLIDARKIREKTIRDFEMFQTDRLCEETHND